MSRLLSRIDHIIHATSDVDSSTDHFTELLGVRADPGGRHPAWGTRNALIALGDSVYLEIFGPDPKKSPEQGRPFDLDRLRSPKLVTWTAEATNLDQLVKQARRRGIDLGNVLPRSRVRPDGVQLKWKMTDPFSPRWEGIVPFFIDWGETPHPAATSVRGGELLDLRAVHPRAQEVREVLDALELDLPVQDGPVPELIATVRTLRGSILEIR